MKKEDVIAGIVYGILCMVIFVVFLSHFNWGSNWVSFLGSLLGGMITLVVMYCTNKAGKENVEQTLKLSKDIHNDGKRLDVMPYVALKYVKSMEETPQELSGDDIGNIVKYEFWGKPKNNSIDLIAEFNLQNIGNGTAVAVRIAKLESTIRNRLYASKSLVHLPVMSDNIMPGDKLRIIVELSIMNDNPDKNSDYTEIPLDRNIDDICMYIEFDDLLGKHYSQHFKIEIKAGHIIVRNISIPQLIEKRSVDIFNLL